MFLMKSLSTAKLSLVMIYISDIHKQKKKKKVMQNTYSFYNNFTYKNNTSKIILFENTQALI